MLDYHGRPEIFLLSYFGNLDKLHRILLSPEQAAYLNLGVLKHGLHTALFAACYGSANLATVMALVEAGADVYALDNMSRIPFNIACNTADPQIIRYFIDTMPDIQLQLNTIDLHGRTPLHALCCSGSLLTNKRRGVDLTKSLNILLEAYDDSAAIISALNKPDNSGLTPLMLAKFYGLDELSCVFIKYGIDISTIATIDSDHIGVRYDYFGNTKLMTAAFDHNIDAVLQELASHNFSSDPNLHNPQPGYSSPLLLACCSDTPGGTAVIAAILDDMRTDPLICDVDGSTALHFAANTGRSDMLAVLLMQDQIRDNINIIDQFGMTALHSLAMASNNTSMRIDSLYLLLDYGIDVFAEDSQGRTAYQVALEYGNYAVALVLYYAMRNKIDIINLDTGGPAMPGSMKLLLFAMHAFDNGFPNSTITESEKYRLFDQPKVLRPLLSF